jgi:hypothetical protein
MIFSQQEMAAMIRSLFRSLGMVFLAAGFIFVIYDGTKSIADKGLHITKLGQTWSDIHQNSLLALKPLIEQKVGGWLWNPVMQTILEQPTWMILGIVGMMLILMGRRKKPLIGYAR